MSINSVTVVGRLTRDMELTYSNSGFAIGKFSLAQNYRKKNGDEYVDEAQFFDVVILGKYAETMKQYLTKGKQIGVSGKLRQQRWQNDQGQNRSKIEILCNDLELLGKKENSNSPPVDNYSGEAGTGSKSADNTPADDYNNDDIPF